MEPDLVLGLVLTGLAFAGLMWAVIHGKYVVERVIRNEYPHHPNPEHRPSGSEGPGGPEDGSSAEGDREEGTPRE